MTDHLIEKLKRQMDEAKVLLEDANIRALAASKRYHDALCRKSGLMGMVAKGARTSVLVQDVQFSLDKPVSVTGLKIRADGTAGYVNGRVWLNPKTKISLYRHGGPA